MAAAGLDNVDILLSDGVLDGHGGLAVAKLDKVDLALVEVKIAAHALHKGGVGRPAENNKIPHGIVGS